LNSSSLRALSQPAMAPVVDADDEQASGDGVSSWLAIVQRDIGRPFCAVMIVEGLSELGSSEASGRGSRGSRVSRVSRICRRDVHGEA